MRHLTDPAVEYLGLEKYPSEASSCIRDSLVAGTYEGILEKYLPQLLSGSPDATESKLPQLACAVSSLQLFVRYNWLEPLPEESLLSRWLPLIKQSTSAEPNPLIVDTLEPYKLTNFLELCQYAGEYFTSKMSQTMTSSNMAEKLWTLRYCVINQTLLDESSPTLYEAVSSLTQEISKDLPAPKNHALKILVELAQAHLVFREITRAREYLDRAKELSGMDIELSGALGRRTRFQNDPIAQLMVKISRTLQEPTTPEFSKEFSSAFEVDIPTDVILNDDTLLPAVDFVSPKQPSYVESVDQRQLSMDESDELEKTELTETEECLLLGLLKLSERSGPIDIDDLHREELMAFLEAILRSSKTWCIQFTALYLRSWHERHNRRRVERAMMQLDHLVNGIRDSAHKPSSHVVSARRHDFLYATLPPPIWKVERILGDIFLSMGANQPALDIFLRLQMWDDVIRCYHSLNKREEAESLIRNLINSDGRTPHLLCLLGDANDDISNYQEAWDLSGGRFARAKRSLGFYYYRVKKYPESIPHFEDTLRVNSLQPDVWYSLATAAMTVEDYDRSAQAYRRYLSFEDDSFEAWNNISKAYIKLGDKPRAWRTLQEALKCNYDEWRIWENYMFVSVDIGALSEVIRAWHRLLDLKKSYTDDQVAAILTSAVDEHRVQDAKFVPNLRKLLGRVAATSHTTPSFWASYARFHLHEDQDSPNMVLECIFKSAGHAIQKPKWTSSKELMKENIQLFTELVELIKKCQIKWPPSTSSDGGDQQQPPDLTRFRLSYNSLLHSIDQTVGRWIDEAAIGEVTAELDKLKISFEQI